METCDLDPFSVIQTPQVANLEEAAMAVQALQIELENYLARLKAAICSDLQDLDDRITALEGP